MAAVWEPSWSLSSFGWLWDNVSKNVGPADFVSPHTKIEHLNHRGRKVAWYDAFFSDDNGRSALGLWVLENLF